MQRASLVHRVLAVFSVASVLLMGADLQGQVLPRGGQLRGFSNNVNPPMRVIPHRLSYHYRYHPGLYSGYPWYAPQTIPYRVPPPRYGYEYPKLGLQYLYPYAYQMGIQVPPDPDPMVLYTPFLDPFIQEVSDAPRSPAVAEGIALMRKGRYAAAGRLFAKNLTDQAAAPELYLLIAETFMALGKLDDADLVLRQAIDVSQNLDFLDTADLPGKFPNRNVLAQKLKALQDPNTTPTLLRGTMLILSGNKVAGLAALRGAARKDTAAKRVYLHFMDAAFTEEEPAEKPAEKSAK